MIYKISPSPNWMEIIKESRIRNYIISSGDNDVGQINIKDLQDEFINLDRFKNVLKLQNVGELIYRENSFHTNPNNSVLSLDWTIYDCNNNIAMEIVGHTKEIEMEKKKFFSKETKKVIKKHFYHEIAINGRTFILYNTCLGKDKQYYTIYEGEKIVSVLYHYDKIVDFGHTLEVYCINDEIVEIMSLLYCLYLNCHQFYKSSKTIIQENGCINESFSSESKYLTDKFNQEFVDRIIAESEKEAF